MAVVRGNTLESGYMLLVPHTTALAEAEPVTVHAAAGPTRTTGESSLLRIFSISLEPSFSHGPTLANGRHIGFGGIHWDFSALFPQRCHTRWGRHPRGIRRGECRRAQDSQRNARTHVNGHVAPGYLLRRLQPYMLCLQAH